MGNVWVLTDASHNEMRLQNTVGLLRGLVSILSAGEPNGKPCSVTAQLISVC